MNLKYDPNNVKIITKEDQIQVIKSLNILPNDLIKFTIQQYLQEIKQYNIIQDFNYLHCDYSFAFYKYLKYHINSKYLNCAIYACIILVIVLLICILSITFSIIVSLLITLFWGVYYYYKKQIVCFSTNILKFADYFIYPLTQVLDIPINVNRLLFFDLEKCLMGNIGNDVVVIK